MSPAEKNKNTDQLNQALSGENIKVRAPVPEKHRPILSEDALRFLGKLARKFESRRQQLLEERVVRQNQIDEGQMPAFPEDTKSIRERDWTVAPIPDDLKKRHVEITGPPGRKMIINALNSGADVYMSDFEDAHSPSWYNNLQGQLNLRDAVRRRIDFTIDDGKSYRLNDETATLLVRPRGWHLDEKHVLVNGEPISGSLFDFGLYFYHNARELLDRGSGPYFYLPKLENHHEARLWNDVFEFAQEELGIPHGSVRVTVLLENILAAFEMDEILYELKDHMSGLNCGRWDYIFSFIKKFRNKPEFVLPDRDQVTMDRHFLNAYVEHLIQTCHRREAHAMGGMAAQIPIKDDPEANEKALEEVRQDKIREVKAGHDGTWVAHPGLVEVAKSVFDEQLGKDHQIDEKREDVNVTAEDLLKVPDGTITEQGLRTNVDVAIQYLESWLRELGCVPIYNLMEDAATAEISRAQVWQWLRHETRLENGSPVTEELIDRTIDEQLDNLKDMVGEQRFENGKYETASDIFRQISTSGEFADFMPLVAYDYLD